MQVAGEIGDRLRDSRAERTGNPRLRPSIGVPVPALFEHLLQGRSPQVEEGDEGELLGVELLDQVRRRVESREEGIGLGQRFAHEVVPATEVPSHLVEMATNLLGCGFEAFQQAIP